jgi:hypothetical protein
MLRFHKASDIALVLKHLMKNDKTITDDDVALSVLINNYVKPFLQECSDPSSDEDDFLELVLDHVFPATLDVMSDDVPHLNLMT